MVYSSKSRRWKRNRGVEIFFVRDPDQVLGIRLIDCCFMVRILWLIREFYPIAI